MMRISCSTFRLFAVVCFFFLAAFLSGGGSAAAARSAFDDPGSRSGAGKAGGDLVAVTGDVASASIALGTSSKIVLLFRNDSAKPINTGVINLYQSSNVTAMVDQNQCAKEALESGAVCAVAMSVKGLQPGRFRIEMLMRHDGRSKLIRTTIEGSVDKTGDGAASIVNDLDVSPSSVDFGTLQKSRTLIESVMLRNVTSKKIKIESVEIDANPQSGFSAKSDCGELETGQACMISVSWSPQQSGPSMGIMMVRHTGATGVLGVKLSGMYNPATPSVVKVFPDAVPGKGLLVSSRESVDFGTSVSSKSSITVSLVNVGDAPLLIDGIKFSNSENGVKIASGGCGAGTMLEPVEACPLTLVWEPVREGDIVDDIQIFHNGARGMLVLPLRGSASRAVNRDAKTIVLGGTEGGGLLRSIAPVSSRELGDGGDAISSSVFSADTVSSADARANGGRKKGQKRKQESFVNVKGAIEGYSITSMAPDRAIISGPGGSRVVFSGEETLIGGVLWRAVVKRSAVELTAGKQKVLLLFDRSLSSVVDSSDKSASGSGSSKNSSN